MSSPAVPNEKSVVSAKASGARALRLKLAERSGTEVVIRTLGRIVYILVDCSGSMKTDDKLRDAASGAHEFARQAYTKGYLVGLIRFNSSAETVLTASRDESALSVRLNTLSAGGGTDMAGAIEEGVRELQNAQGERVLYIVTDGQPDDRNETLAAACKAKNVGISIMTLGTDDADRDFLAKLATRAELSAKVERTQLKNSVGGMARFLLSDGR